jgi:transposase InsO family protein
VRLTRWSGVGDRVLQPPDRRAASWSRRRWRWRSRAGAKRAGSPITPISDHGGQHTAVVFGERCAQAGITVSMGSVGDCYDNAVCEALHATLKRELVNRRSWPTQAEAQTAVFGIRVHRGVL